MSDLILASASAVRRALLQGVGLSFVSQAADIDERAVEAGLEGHVPNEIAVALAEAKAASVSQANRSTLVIGADQVLAFEGAILHKAADREAAHVKLSALQGKTHTLAVGVALVLDGETLWTGTDEANLSMRSLTDADITAYLDQAGDAATASVGAYRLEEVGAALFDSIDGDYFTILGLPLLPLLGALRTHGIDPLKPKITS